MWQALGPLRPNIFVAQASRLTAGAALVQVGFRLCRRVKVDTASTAKDRLRIRIPHRTVQQHVHYSPGAEAKLASTTAAKILESAVAAYGRLRLNCRGSAANPVVRPT